MKRFIIIIMLCLIGAMTVANPEPRGLIGRIKQRIETRKKYKDSWERVQFTRDSLSRIAYGWPDDGYNHIFYPFDIFHYKYKPADCVSAYAVANSIYIQSKHPFSKDHYAIHYYTGEVDYMRPVEPGVYEVCNYPKK